MSDGNLCAARPGPGPSGPPRAYECSSSRHAARSSGLVHGGRHPYVAAMFVCLGAATAFGQQNREPRIGYIYPAGSQRGTRVEILVGGQSLRGVSGAHVSGSGVRARVIQHYRPLMNVVREQREELRRRLAGLIRERMAGMPRRGRRLSPLLEELSRGGAGPTRRGPTTQPAVELPDHPLLRNLENKSLAELLHVRNELLMLRSRQPSPQIAESVLLLIDIDRDAALGDRELRLQTPQGLTNPMCFQVGALPEAGELEPNDPTGPSLLAEQPPLEMPVLFNGQIKPGDVDRIRFSAREGQQLAIRVHARHLVPYLADAVPGWFQAVVSLYDPAGHEVAFADDFHFDPDPVLSYRTSVAGEYELEIRDALYRGRDDFVYRVAIGEAASIHRLFPPGGQAIATTRPPGEAGAEIGEVEPNPHRDTAQRIELPRVITGRIGRAGDVDVFQFEARPGEEVVAEVQARRLASPLDSLLRVTDASGQVLTWNDDHEDLEAGLLTHHADSYLRVRLPEAGRYSVQLTDSRGHGGDAYRYRLRVGPPAPDFGLRIVPSSLSLRPGGTAAACVYAVRKDGFDGEIEVVLKNAPPGLLLTGGTIPRGCDRLFVTLTAPERSLGGLLALELEGVCDAGGRTLRRPVVPADDLMQAFIYRHLVAAQQLLVADAGPRRSAPRIEPIGPARLPLPQGGTARLELKGPRGRPLQGLQFGLREAPDGVTLQEVQPHPGGLALVLKVSDDKVQPGLAGNLIVEAFGSAQGRPAGGRSPNQPRRASLGVLPAIPFEVVPPLSSQPGVHRVRNRSRN